MQFTEEQQRVWQALYARQLPNVQCFACREYLEGLALLDLSPERIPSLEELNAAITPRTGWRLRRTPVRYSDAVPWYRHFARRTFLITDYMRAWEELEFTPEPDMFHDIFGHLPFMTLPRYTALQDLFAAPFLRAGPQRREQIKRLAWFSTEFGLIRQDGELTILGAGILSSVGETLHVMSGRVPLEPFSVENVIKHGKAIYHYNEVLFVVDSLEALRAELSAYFDSIPDERPSDEAAFSAAGESLEDWELADLRDPPRLDPSAAA